MKAKVFLIPTLKLLQLLLEGQQIMQVKGSEGCRDVSSRLLSRIPGCSQDGRSACFNYASASSAAASLKLRKPEAEPGRRRRTGRCASAEALR